MDDRHGGIPSRASVRGHPLHPALVPFPIAFLLGTLLSDLAYWWGGDPFWARASYWLLAAGVAGGAAAALPGLADFLSEPRIRALRAARAHLVGNVAAMALAIANLWLRTGDPAGAILPWGILLSAVVAGILGGTGYLGGELVFRHRVGGAPGGAAVARRAASPARTALHGAGED
jgi:uncharacterized membrane protein